LLPARSRAPEKPRRSSSARTADRNPAQPGAKGYERASDAIRAALRSTDSPYVAPVQPVVDLELGASPRALAAGIRQGLVPRLVGVVPPRAILHPLVQRRTAAPGHRRCHAQRSLPRAEPKTSPSQDGTTCSPIPGRRARASDLPARARGLTRRRCFGSDRQLADGAPTPRISGDYYAVSRSYISACGHILAPPIMCSDRFPLIFPGPLVAGPTHHRTRGAHAYPQKRACTAAAPSAR
jgi:hypothetical protein